MDGFDSMFDMNRDGELDLGERALQMEFLDRAAAGDGDVDWRLFQVLCKLNFMM